MPHPFDSLTLAQGKLLSRVLCETGWEYNARRRVIPTLRQKRAKVPALSDPEERSDEGESKVWGNPYETN